MMYSNVALLKPFIGNAPSTLPTLPPIDNGRALPVPERILRAELRRGLRHIQVQWVGMDEANATWEMVDTFRQAYPEFQLEDELFSEEGRDVMVGKVYVRRNKRQRG